MAKPTPLPIGRPSPHVLQSRGADNYIMNFYVTNYSTSFVKPNTDLDKSKFSDIPAYSGGLAFKPRSAPEAKGTGFTSNVRPQIFYKESMDTLDNPIMKHICAENYQTMQQRQFQPYLFPDGTEDLPVQVQDLNSAYTKYTRVHNPRPAEVADLYIDTKYRSPFDQLPKHVPLLHSINNKDPIPRETSNNGVKYMSTEYDVRYEKPENAKIDKHSTFGPKQSSGFVTNQENDTLAGIPGEYWLYKTRSTGRSNYQDKFPAYEFPRGSESLPNVNGLTATDETGHSKSILPPKQVNPRTVTFGNPTEYDTEFLGRQRPAPHISQNLNSAFVGPKEESANTRLEGGYVHTADDPRRFITNYQTKFGDFTPKGKDREGYVYGGVTGSTINGFTKNTHVQDPGSFNPTSILETSPSYQARSIRARDTFFNDSTHNHKFNLKNNVETYQENNPNSVKVACT